MACCVLDVGGWIFPRGNLVLDIRTPNNGTVEHYVIGDACHMPFREKCFSRIESHGSLNYFSSDISFFHEVRRTLRENGILMISANTYYSLTINLIKVLLNNPKGSLRLILNTIRRRYRWYSPRTLQRALEKGGLTTFRIYPNVSLYWRPTRTPHNLLAIANKPYKSGRLL